MTCRPKLLSCITALKSKRDPKPPKIDGFEEARLWWFVTMFTASRRSNLFNTQSAAALMSLVCVCFGSSRTLVLIRVLVICSSHSRRKRGIRSRVKMSQKSAAKIEKRVWSGSRRVNKFRGLRMTQQLRKLLCYKLTTGCFSRLFLEKHSIKILLQYTSSPRSLFLFSQIIFV